MSLRFNVDFAEGRVHSDEFGKLRIDFGGYETKGRENCKDRKRQRRVAPGTPESTRQFMRKEISNSFSALGICAVDAAVGPYDQTVEIVHQTRVARFSARDC